MSDEWRTLVQDVAVTTFASKFRTGAHSRWLRRLGWMHHELVSLLLSVADWLLPRHDLEWMHKAFSRSCSYFRYFCNASRWQGPAGGSIVGLTFTG